MLILRGKEKINFALCVCKMGRGECLRERRIGGASIGRGIWGGVGEGSLLPSDVKGFIRED